MRKAEVPLYYQPLIPPPAEPEALYRNACANDQATIKHWHDIWLGNASANKSLVGSFLEKSVGQEFNRYRYQPIIVAGSGPSLKHNAHELKNRGAIPLVSCLHNFHYFEDQGIAPEYYVTLDAGIYPIQEVYTGGTKTPDEYWEMTKDRTLIAYVGSHPDLIKKWKGKILFYNAPVPNEGFMDLMDKIEPFAAYLSSGGNVLGACVYFAKAILGAGQIIFVGADFCFNYEDKFYTWNDPEYDGKQGQVIRVRDIYGIPVNTWPSYWGFKQYFDSLSIRLPGVWYNCTEGGCLGAYNEGNINTFKYLDLKDCLKILNANAQIKDLVVSSIGPRLVLYS